MYDKEVIRRHLFALIADLRNLEKYKSITENDLLNNLDLLGPRAVPGAIVSIPVGEIGRYYFLDSRIRGNDK